MAEFFPGLPHVLLASRCDLVVLQLYEVADEDRARRYEDHGQEVIQRSMDHDFENGGVHLAASPSSVMVDGIVRLEEVSHEHHESIHPKSRTVWISVLLSPKSLLEPFVGRIGKMHHRHRVAPVV